MKICVIGMGRAGNRHARLLTELGHEVVGCDVAARQMAWTSLRDLVKWSGKLVEIDGTKEPPPPCDAVVIATPAVTHGEVLKHVIARGLPVLVEKPLGVFRSMDDVEVWMEMKKSMAAPIAVGFNLRFHPGVTDAKKHIDKIDPFWAMLLCCQKAPPDCHYDLIHDWASHEIDLAMHLFGSVPADDINGISGDGSISVQMLFGQMEVSLHSDMLSSVPMRRTVVAGHRGAIDIDFIKTPVSDDCYRAELRAFINLVEGKPSGSLCLFDEGLRCASLCALLEKSHHARAPLPDHEERPLH